MKTVLWISRHTMTDDQIRDLERIVGDTVTLICCKDTVDNLQTLEFQISQADLVAAVLPLDLMKILLELARDKVVLRARSKREATGRMITLTDGRKEPEFTFVHDGWEQILELRLRTRRL